MRGSRRNSAGAVLVVNDEPGVEGFDAGLRIGFSQR